MALKNKLYGKIRGCLYGGAIGDAMGAPPEGKNPDEIKARYGEILDFVEPWDGPSDVGKGDGRHTDDTHMVRVLSEMYIDADRRLDVFDFAQEISNRIGSEVRYVSEYGREVVLVDRLFHPENGCFCAMAWQMQIPVQAASEIWLTVGRLCMRRLWALSMPAIPNEPTETPLIFSAHIRLVLAWKRLELWHSRWPMRSWTARLGTFSTLVWTGLMKAHVPLWKLCVRLLSPIPTGAAPCPECALPLLLMTLPLKYFGTGATGLMTGIRVGDTA